MEMKNDPRTDFPPRRIQEVAKELGLDPDVIYPSGH